QSTYNCYQVATYIHADPLAKRKPRQQCDDRRDEHQERVIAGRASDGAPLELLGRPRVRRVELRGIREAPYSNLSVTVAFHHVAQQLPRISALGIHLERFSGVLFSRLPVTQAKLDPAHRDMRTR